MSAPVERTSTYRFASMDALRRAAAGDRFYTRYGHPSFTRVEAKFAALHGAACAVLFASGVAAVSAVVQAFCRVGDRVVAMADCYGGTRALLDRLAERGFIEIDYVAFDDLSALDDHLNGATLFLGETPTNPLLRVVDLPTLAAACRAADARFVLDATFAGPANLKPLAHGVDLVIESATKSLGGHSDLMGGLVAGGADDCAALADVRRIFGAVPDPETAWLLDRGLKTYAVRAARQTETASALAGRLASDPRAHDVRHLGLETHPDHGVIERLGLGSCALLAFEVHGDAVRFVDALRLVANAPSLGGVESLVCLPRYTSHAHVPAGVRAALGIDDGLVRISVGLEDEADLWADLDHALDAASA